MRYHELIIGGELIPFYYGYDCMEEMAERLSKLQADRFIVVTDHRVKLVHGATLANRLGRIAPTLFLSAEPGESSKSLEILLRHAERAIEWGATRRSVVLAYGGGVPGNLGGLLAALLFRGIRLVHIPTTLIGMLDSVVSLKQAVNSRHGKNLLGTYYQPTLVLADTRSLETLPLRELRAGICEVIKNALAIHPHTIEQLREHLNPDCKYQASTFQFLLESSLAAKTEVMAADKFEKGRGLILEYGHTLGHAIELAAHYVNREESLSHGEAVGIGMLGAAKVSYQLGGLDSATVELHYDLLARVGAPLCLPAGVELEQVLRFIRFDNKRGYHGKQVDCVDMILLRAPGVPLGHRDMPLTPVPIRIVERCAESLALGKMERRSALSEVK